MTVIMKEGKRQCNARCYNAKGKKCHCICGGKNHGVGIEQAMENTKEAFDVTDFENPVKAESDPKGKGKIYYYE